MDVINEGDGDLGTPAAAHPEPLLVDARTAAAMLGVSRTLIYELMASGELPSVLIRRCRRISVAELHVYVGQLRTGR